MFGLQMFNDVENLHQEIQRLFHGYPTVREFDAANRPNRLQLRDAGDAFVVDASLPGIDIEKLEINVLGRKLTLSGEFAGVPVDENIRWHRQERRSGAFQQALQLPLDVDQDKVEAEYKNGILQIRLPKASSVLPKKISVKVA